MKTFTFLAVLASVTTSVNGFFSGATAKTRVSPALVDEAFAIYNKRYPAKDASESSTPFYNSWGVPKSIGTNKKRVFERDEKIIRATFQELASVYGGEEALQMTKDLPPVLGFNKANFKPTYAEFSNIFGAEEAKEMVMRNPGLLAVKPEDAATSDDQTMQFSYIVAATRPAGPVLLYGTLGLLSLPVIEGISGVPFRANLLQSILN